MVRVPLKNLAIKSAPLFLAFIINTPVIAAGSNSPPNEREIVEASSNSPTRAVQIRRSNSSEAASPFSTSPAPRRNQSATTVAKQQAPIIGETAGVSRTRPVPQNSAPTSNAPARAQAQESKTIKSNGVQIATEAEMALALNIPLEPKTAQDARFVTSDMRPQDVAPWQKIGSPYQVNGVWYIPAHEPNYDEIGEASWYGSQFNGRPTANGEIFDMTLVTVAHPTLPIPSLVEVINLENGRSIVARVNDRGPFAHDRLVDVSQRGAELLGFKEKGRARVRVRYVGQAPQLPTNANAPKSLQQASVISPPPVTKQVANESSKQSQSIVKTASTPIASQEPPIDTNGTFVQIGAFSNLANAERLLQQNASIGSGKIIPVQNENGSIFRVMIGPLDPTEAALKAQEAKSNGIAGARVVANIS